MFFQRRAFNSIEARKKKISPFDNIWTVKAIFQSLSETAQQYILRMVIGGAKKLLLVKSWSGGSQPILTLRQSLTNTS